MGRCLVADADEVFAATGLMLGTASTSSDSSGLYRTAVRVRVLRIIGPLTTTTHGPPTIHTSAHKIIAVCAAMKSND